MKLRPDICLNLSVAGFVFFAASVFSHEYEPAAVFGFATFLLAFYSCAGCMILDLRRIAENLLEPVPEDGEDGSQAASPEGKA